MRSLTAILALLLSLNLYAQTGGFYYAAEDDSLYWSCLLNPLQQEVEFSISDGFYNVGAIDSSRYWSEQHQYSLGFTYQRAMSDDVWGQLILYFTTDKFNYQKYDPAINYREPPKMTKEVIYLDVGFTAMYDYLKSEKVKSYAYAGILIGTLMKGGDEITGVYSASSTTNPRLLFSPTRSVLLGTGMKYYISRHIAFDMKFNLRYFYDQIVYGEQNDNPKLRTELGICYSF